MPPGSVTFFLAKATKDDLKSNICNLHPAPHARSGPSPKSHLRPRTLIWSDAGSEPCVVALGLKNRKSELTRAYAQVKVLIGKQ